MYELIARQYCINKFNLPVDHTFRLSSEGVEKKPSHRGRATPIFWLFFLAFHSVAVNKQTVGPYTTNITPVSDRKGRGRNSERIDK